MSQTQPSQGLSDHQVQQWGASFDAVAGHRRSVRAFLGTPVTPALLRHVLTIAQGAPSNCDSQPWYVHVVSGALKDRLSKALLADMDASHLTPDWPFDGKHYTGVHAERRVEQAKLQYDALGIARGDVEGRRISMRRNLEFFGAPHVAMLFVPDFAQMREASDLGMYTQTLMLALAAHGLASCPQTVLGLYAQTIRDQLGIASDRKLLYGLSFGYPDTSSPGWNIRMPRASLDEVVSFHE